MTNITYQERLNAARQAAVTLRQAAEWKAAKLTGDAARIAQESGATGNVQFRDPFLDAITVFADSVLGMIEEIQTQCQAPSPPARGKRAATAGTANSSRTT